MHLCFDLTAFYSYYCHFRILIIQTYISEKKYDLSGTETADLYSEIIEYIRTGNIDEFDSELISLISIMSDMKDFTSAMNLYIVQIYWKHCEDHDTDLIKDFWISDNSLEILCQKIISSFSSSTDPKKIDNIQWIVKQLNDRITKLSDDEKQKYNLLVTALNDMCEYDVDFKE